MTTIRTRPSCAARSSAAECFAATAARAHRSRGRVAVVIFAGLLALLIGAKAAAAQQVQQAQQLRAMLTQVDGTNRNRDDAPPLALAESEDLNRVLRKVTEFFAQEPPKWDEGVRLMQDLLEGKVFDAAVADEQLLDPFQCVYSADRRLYIPFGRYCQQLLSRMPPEGLEAYRFVADSRVNSDMQVATEQLDVTRLQRLAELFFASSFGPEIVELLADLAELEGRLSQAVHFRQRLLEDYPDLGDERRLGLLLRQVHAAALLGEHALHEASLAALKERGLERQVVVAGESVRIADLERHPAFALDANRSVEPPVRAVDPATPSLGPQSFDYSPLWRFAFTEPDPYGLRPKNKSGNQNDGMIFFGSMQALTIPSVRHDRPGTRVLVWQDDVTSEDSLRIAIKDHDRLHVVGAISGKIAHRGAGKPTPPVVQNQALRVRTPLTDVALMSVSTDGRLLYATVGNKPVQQGGNSEDFAYRNEVEAIDIKTGEVVWNVDASSNKDKVFFQAPPLRHGKWLYAPVRRGQSFCIARIDPESGGIDKVVSLHSGGTRLLRVPAVMPVVADGSLLCLTNAGAVASLRLPNLELRWLRAYESVSPEEDAPVEKPRSTSRHMSYGVREQRLEKWKPIEPILVDGMAILAPIDSDTIFALDIQSGEPRWFLPRVEKRRGTLFRELVGIARGRLCLAGGNTLQIVDARSGRRLAEAPLLTLPNGEVEGWGTVTDTHVWLPFDGGAYRFRLDDASYEGAFVYPSDELGSETWKSLPQRLQFAGPVLLSICESGVRAFAIDEDLAALPGTVLERARRRMASGEVQAAFDMLEGHLTQVAGQGATKIEEAKLLVRLAGELAQESAPDARAGALAILERSASALQRAGLPLDPRLLIFRAAVLDPREDAREIRTLREQLADLQLDLDASSSLTTRDGK